MKKILLLLLAGISVCSAQVSSVTVDANGTVMNFQPPSTKAVNYPAGKLAVNGVLITGLESDASTTVKGVTKLSVAPASSSNPIAVGDNDSRNTNARTPTAHASTHANGGTDPVTLIIGQITGLQTALDLKAPLASPTFTGVPLAPTASVDTNTTQIATTGFVLAQAANAIPVVASTGAVGTSTRYARQDHVHPVQTSVTGNAATAAALQTARTINGTSFDGTTNITVTAAAGTLTGNTLAAGVTASSLTSASGGAFGTAAFTASSAYATSAQGTKADNAGAITGIVKSDGSANFSAITDSSSNWNTAFTDRLKWDGGSTGLTAGTGRTSLGGTTAGQSVFMLTNPSAITFIRINADNSVDALNATNFRTAIGAGTGSGDALVANPLSQFAATTSAQLAGVISDENGTGALLFDSATNPTLNGATINNGSLTISGNISSAAWTTSGLRLKGISGTLTDTTSSGTVAAAYTNKLGGNTIAASSATTFTDYISLYLSEPVAGTNVTLTNKWALGADSLYIGTSNPVKITSAGVLTATSPVFITPALGTPASGIVTNLTGTASININGTVGATTPTTGAFTSETFTLSLKSTTALATPSALSATQFTSFASTVSGAAIMGYGTTNDVSLMNRAGTVVLGVGPNTAEINIPGSGAASTSSLKISGVPFAGTGTTSFPLVYINDANATASTTLNTAGTYFGVNGDGTQDLMNLLKDGTSQFKITSGGAMTATGSLTGIGFLSIDTGSSRVGINYSGSPRIDLPSGGLLSWASASIGSGGDTMLARHGIGQMSLNSTMTEGQWASLFLGTRDSGTNTITNAITTGHQTTGTAAAGLGEAWLGNLDSSTTADQNAFRLYYSWTTATHASRTSKAAIQLVNNAAALADVLTLNGDGSATLAAAGTSAGSIAIIDGTQTFTNKSLTSPTFTGTVAGTPAWASSQAITLSTAAQPNVTSLGNLSKVTIYAADDGTDSALSIRQSNATTNGFDLLLDQLVDGVLTLNSVTSNSATNVLTIGRIAPGVTVNTNVSVRHLAGNSTAPTIANGAGAGTSPGTPSLTGTDAAGQITIVTGTLPSISAADVTVTFNAAYGTAPYVVLWPANAAASTLSFLPYVTSTTTTFTVNSATVALAGSATYVYNYHVIQ